MKCETLQFDLPLYLDDILSDEQRDAIDAHLPSCPLCRLRLDEYRELRNDLRMIASPQIPSDLLQSVRNSVETTVGVPTISIGSAPPKSFAELFRYWLMPYSVGTVTALVMTFALLTNLISTRNAVNEIAVNQNPSTETTMLLAEANTASIREELSLPDGYTTLALEGNTPRVNPAGTLFALTKSIVRGEMEDEEVVIVADVFGNGLARISEIVDPPSNEKALRELERAFQTDPDEAPFLPQRMQPDSTAVRVVLKIQRVDVVD